MATKFPGTRCFSEGNNSAMVHVIFSLVLLYISSLLHLMTYVFINSLFFETCSIAGFNKTCIIIFIFMMHVFIFLLFHGTCFYHTFYFMRHVFIIFFIS